MWGGARLPACADSWVVRDPKAPPSPAKVRREKGGATGYGLLCEKAQRDGVGHGFVAGGGRVEVVSAVVVGAEAVGLARVARYGVEVDDCVEVAGGANPLVDGLAVGFAARARVVVIGAYVGRDGCADDAESVRVGAGDDLFVGGNDIFCALDMFCFGYFCSAGETS